MKPIRPPALTRRALLGLGAGLALGALTRASAQEQAASAPAPATSASERGTSASEPGAAPPWRLVDLNWVDKARDRAVPARLYLPEGNAAVPLLVFSHGIGGSRFGYSYLGKHLAANGVACLHLQHVGSDRSIWAGNPLGLVGRLQGAAQDTEAMARAADLRFALDSVLAPGPLAERIDAQRLAAGGHSYGANTTMLAAGARVLRDGQPLKLSEPRLKGVLLLSAPPFYGETDLRAVLSPVQLPALHITTTEDVINVPGYHSPVEDRYAIYAAMGSPHKALAVFDWGSHSIFTDRSGPGGPELNARVKQATQDLSLAWLQAVLAPSGGGTPALPAASALRSARDKHASLLARFEATG